VLRAIPLIQVGNDGWLSWGDRRVKAALGRSGVTADKREGDGATPLGLFPLRRLWYRADRLDRPVTGLDCLPIDPDQGWSDDPADPAYNLPVRLPNQASHERLWRDDAVYDLIVPLGYNDAPAIPGSGSAIFLHVAHPDYRPTEGCIAIARDDLLALLTVCGPATTIRIA
jgi:L,D-peptidoglycan transpeptidase YkuD (ErfK/YbiS/YcfS/YnhG family)